MMNSPLYLPPRLDLYDGIDRLCHAFPLMTYENVLSVRCTPCGRVVGTMGDDGCSRIVLDRDLHADLQHSSLGTTEDVRSEYTVLTRDQQLVFKVLRNKVTKDESMGDAEKLLGLALLWSFADVYGLVSIHESLLHEGAWGYGYSNKAEIMRWKQQSLLSQNGRRNYDVFVVHEIDTENRTALTGWERLQPSELNGRGTEVIQFSQDWKVVHVQSIPHRTKAQERQQIS